MSNTPSTKTDWSQLNHYRLDCSTMLRPIEISHFFRQNNIKSYIYKLMYKNIDIKYGESACDNSRTPGNRVYTQVGGLDSFGLSKLYRSGSIEFRELANDFQIAHLKVLDHRDLTIEIWCFDRYNFITTDHIKEIKQAESELIQTHMLRYNKLPIGNKRDEKTNFNRSAVIAVVYDRFFT